jgi:hypothetical protein
MSGYNYSKFNASQYDLDSFKGPALGQKAPDVTLESLNGAPVRLLDIEGDFLVLEMGSITCPLFQGRREGMAEIVAQNPDTKFAILYVREAHPGATRPKHHSETDKKNNALALQNEDGEGREIWLDTLEGNAHLAFGQYPNSVFIINRNGCIVYMADWNNPRATAKALKALKAGKPATGMGLFLPARPPVVLRTLKSAGKGAAFDFFSGLPRLAWKNLIKRNLRVLLGKQPKIAPDASC